MIIVHVMQRQAALIAGLILAVVCLQSPGCTNDEPTAPSEPYLLTRVNITRNISPLPSVVLGGGQLQTFKYEVAYTIASPDTITDVIVFSGFYGYDANDRRPGGGFFPDSAKYVAGTPRDFLPNANSGIDSVTISFTIPSNFVQLTLIAGPIDPATRIFKTSDTYSWIVQ